MSKDGGPAFPMPASEHSQGGHFEQYGMSLRDYFAGQALAGLTACSFTYCGGEKITTENATRVTSRRAYEYADAMLAAREKDNKA
jgi:hypothetical protein